MNIKLVGIPLALGAVMVLAVGLFQSLGKSSAKSLEGSTWILDPRTDLVKSVNLGRSFPWYSTIEFLKGGRYKWTIFPGSRGGVDWAGFAPAPASTARSTGHGQADEARMMSVPKSRIDKRTQRPYRQPS